MSSTLRRVEDLHDDRVARLLANWRAIKTDDSDERAFCGTAGRMGLDPYDSDAWDPSLASLLETGIEGDPERPLVDDVFEAADTDTAEAVWSWVAATEAELRLQARIGQPVVVATASGRPADFGYETARGVRNGLKLDPDRPALELSAAGVQLGIGPIRFEDRNALNNRLVKAAVGWQAGREPLIAGPKPNRDDSRRFLEARGLYHAAFACGRGARLITNAHTWDQQASRAFAAELLAPREGLLPHVQPSMSPEDWCAVIQSLADKYTVSARVIAHQLENAGIEVEVE